MHGHARRRDSRSRLVALAAAAFLAAALGACSGGGDGHGAQGGVAPRGASAVDAAVTTGATTFQMRDIVALMADTPSDEARFAAASLAAQKDAGAPAPQESRLDPRATPDYYGVANWTNTPLVRKFVDAPPGVGPAAANSLGQYIPVAVPDTVTYPGSDYYELAVRDYSEKLHSDLPATRLRGTCSSTSAPTRAGATPCGRRPSTTGDLSSARGAAGRCASSSSISCRRVRPATCSCRWTRPRRAPVRGPTGGDDLYPTNRASLHLHGGLAPWISGGTQYQW